MCELRPTASHPGAQKLQLKAFAHRRLVRVHASGPLARTVLVLHQRLKAAAHVLCTPPVRENGLLAAALAGLAVSGRLAGRADGGRLEASGTLGAAAAGPGRARSTGFCITNTRGSGESW